jgi:hypothetical protein
MKSPIFTSLGLCMALTSASYASADDALSFQCQIWDPSSFAEDVVKADLNLEKGPVGSVPAISDLLDLQIEAMDVAARQSQFRVGRDAYHKAAILSKPILAEIENYKKKMTDKHLILALSIARSMASIVERADRCFDALSIPK